MSIAEQILAIEQAFAPFPVYPCVLFSSFTQKWYVSTNSDVSIYAALDNGGDATIVEHRDTQEEALSAYFQRLKETKYFYPAKYSNSNYKCYPIFFKKWDEASQSFIIISVPNSDTLFEDNSLDFLSVEKLVSSIESFTKIDPRSQGTIIQRVMLDKNLLEERGVVVPFASLDREAYNVWSVGVGKVSEPKMFFYGWTMLDALKKAFLTLETGVLKTVEDEMNEALDEDEK